MNIKKVIITLLVLTIILSLITIAFNVLSNKSVFIEKRGSNDQASVGLYVEGSKPLAGSASNDNSNIGLYVESG